MTMDRLSKSYEDVDRIGVIGSPSTTSDLTIDVLASAVSKRLVGNMSVFKYMQDNQDHYALGQITEILMQNIWAQDPTMRGIIRQKGEVSPITENQDIHTAKMVVGSVFSKIESQIKPSILGTVPPTGTSVKLINSEIMDSLLDEYKDELFYLGKTYGTQIRMPMWLKHFGRGQRGSNEAYHIGVFGKTGSGKSVMARMLMTGYARHKELSIFILDPQGEFSKDLVVDGPLRKTMEEHLDREVKVYHVHNIILEGWNLFSELLVGSEFFRRLGIIHEDNRIRAVSEITRILKKDCSSGSEKSALENAHSRLSFDTIWNALRDESVLEMIYTGRNLRERVKNMHQNANPNEFFKIWASITNLFRSGSGRKSARELASEIDHSDGLVTVIDLSNTNIEIELLWNDTTKLIVIGEFLKEITKAAESKFKEDKQLNCLVIVDEAHRLAPRETPQEVSLQNVKDLLVDGIRTTRKYGLGWMFISQTLSSLDREIINQTRIYIFGFGLAYGIERQALRDVIGGAEDAIRLYQMFRDPQSSLGKADYPFMTVGPISPLSFSGTPLFFNALTYPTRDEPTGEFLEMNFPRNEK